MSSQPASSQPVKRSSCLFTLFKVVLALIVIVALVIFLVGYFVLDGNYELQRQVTIKAPPAAVHQQVGDLREWPNWLPFTKQDPSVKTTIETPTGVGAHQHWTSESGNGELTFTASDENKGIEFDMLFDKKWKSKGELKYEPVGEETKVTWKMKGKNEDFAGKWMAAVTPLLLGPMFEQGLNDLKQKVEGTKGGSSKAPEDKKPEDKRPEDKKPEDK